MKDANDILQDGRRLDLEQSEPIQVGGNGATAPAPVNETFPVRLLTTPPTPTRWLFDGLLPAGGCGILAAAPKALKTWLTFLMGLALVTGGKVLDRWQVKATGKTLFYSPESGWNARTQRMWGLCWGMGINPLDVVNDLPFINARLDLSREQHAGRLEATVAEHNPRLVVIDPLVSAHMGLDENAAGDVMTVLNPLRDIASARPDTSILVVHHHSKAAGDRSRNLGLRGSSALGGWWDTLITLQRAGDDSAAPRRIDVEHRDAPAPEPGGFRLATGPADREGHSELNWFRLNPCDPPKVKKGGGGQSGRQLETTGLAEVLELIKQTSGTITRSKGAKKLGWDHGKFNRYFGRLEEQGKVKLGDGKLMEVAK